MKLVTIFCQTQNVFPYLLEKKHFVQNVQGLGISSLRVNWMSIKDGLRQESWPVIQCIDLNKDIQTILQPNLFITT
jgi:hypothetical protein